MNVVRTSLPDVLILEPRVFGDDRGFFMESYNRRTLRDVAGIDAEFVQDNHSRSARGVLRGLHYQLVQPQGKLVRVTNGAVFDVALDLRRSSVTFGKVAVFELSEQNRRIAWIPPGFAHGFLVLTAFADFLYKATDYYAPEHERCVLWNDPALCIPWPLQGPPQLSPRDASGSLLAQSETYA
jgi:dTDP-4-dehydrorhamnose 3,5-epimerase